MKPNYNPYKHFASLYKDEIREQFKTIFELKLTDSPKHGYHEQHNTIKLDKSDRFTVYRHIKNMYEIVKISDLFEGREVVDVGVGFGGSYYPLRFGRPKKLICVDPFEENIALARDLGYDECNLMGWEDYTFPSASVVFLRGNWLPDYEPFFKRLKEHNVTDLIIIQYVLPLELPFTNHYIYFPVTKENICRWSYNQTIDLAKMPSMGEIKRLASQFNFGLYYSKPLHRNGFDVVKTEDLKKHYDQIIHLMHFSKVEG